MALELLRVCGFPPLISVLGRGSLHTQLPIVGLANYILNLFSSFSGGLFHQFFLIL
jgi:hypothetical protein